MSLALLPTCQVRIAADGRRSIVCRLCGRESSNPHDVDERYCGACHVFHAAVASARELHRAGASHECSEWPTAVGTCAVCGQALEQRATP